ncbi:MAG TPA: carboxylesterase/lipase family protein [Arenimonas sp.]|nr:carboxylesterase/lipase family protein [Arenimonas sp.]
MRSRVLPRFFFSILAMCGLAIFAGNTLAADSSNGLSSTAAYVQIDDGMLAGSHDKSVFSFKGIPFAAAPVAQWRWREPQPVETWNGIRTAKKFGNACIQTPGLSEKNGGSPGKISEDCLYLNVWTPGLQQGAKLPVMVWIHGGGLVFGSGAVPGYGGDSLAKRGAVIVNINYRMGLLGFFSHPALDAENTGVKNFGLLDQIAALKWVQKNISAFGGDPGNVTIFGQSAGAESVLALYSSPLARGLFHKGIAQSPYGIPGHTLEKARNVGVAIASELGLGGIRASAAQLRAVPAEKFAEFQKPELNLSPGFIAGDAALPATILDTFQKKQQAAMPLIIGNNSDEATVATAFGVDPAKVIQGLGKSKIFVKPLYPKVANDKELGRQVMRDAVFTAFARRISYLQSQRAPVWRYYFSYVQERLRGSQPGVGHGGEVPYMLDTGNTCACLPVAFSKSDSNLAQRIGDSWVAFARTGNPQVSGLPQWQKDSVKNDRVLEFSETITLRKSFMQPRINALILGLKAAD